MGCVHFIFKVEIYACFLFDLVLRQVSGDTVLTVLEEHLQKRPLHEIHGLIASRIEVSQDFVDKLIALHLGHISLTVEDLTEYFFHLDRIFHTFAHHSQDYLSLSKNDQAALLIANAPLYYHLYLTRYENLSSIR